jgi:formylglycine-generating enzyme required for sulfatase activity
MKRTILQIILTILCFRAQAQKVSNIRAEQRGKDIVVLYSLESAYPCDVNLLLSQNNGSTWSAPLKKVSGDVGKYIIGGENQIFWKVLEEREQLVGEEWKFKVVANLIDALKPEMVFVQGGTFKMGSDHNKYEGPVHGVLLSSFLIGKYEVTQFEWREIMGNNPSYFAGCDNCPVEQVTWQEVQLFIRKLNEKTGLSYRLPTEAEWEYAAKGGKVESDFLYSGSNMPQEVGWYFANSEKKTWPVGRKSPNELGIYDLSGNIAEWCSDYYGDYHADIEVNPKGPEKGSYRVFRGGCWEDSFEIRLKVTVRSEFYPFVKDNAIGFRLALSVKPNKSKI